MNLDASYKTVDGKQVRLYCLDACGSFPVHGAILINGRWFVQRWTASGKYCDYGCPHDLDLVPAGKRIERTVYVNVNQDTVDVYNTAEMCKVCQTDGILACAVEVKIQCNEGDGSTIQLGSDS